MFYKNFLTILVITFMFSFFQKTEAQYEKLFFDLNIKKINN